MPDQLQAKLLKAAIAEKCAIDMDVTVFATIDSTNSWSLLQCKAGTRPPFACFTEVQTQGKGRRGKHWLMPARANIALSLSWPFDLSRQPLYLLPLSVAVAIVNSLESFGLKQVQIKWPNDVYVCGKKIAGVLIETRSANVNSSIGEAREMAAVIGIGLNYDMASLAQEPSSEKFVFTDICEQIKMQHTDRMPGRAEAAACLLQHVIGVCQNFQQQAAQHLEVFRSRYDYCWQKNVEIILENNEVLSGIAQGVTDRAELIAIIEGERRVFNSADVSVKASPASREQEEAVSAKAMPEVS